VGGEDDFLSVGAPSETEHSGLVERHLANRAARYRNRVNVRSPFPDDSYERYRSPIR
jgi:hypothetical protein